MEHDMGAFALILALLGNHTQETAPRLGAAIDAVCDGDPAVTRRQVLDCRGVVAPAMEELTDRIAARMAQAREDRDEF